MEEITERMMTRRVVDIHDDKRQQARATSGEMPAKNSDLLAFYNWLISRYDLPVEWKYHNGNVYTGFFRTATARIREGEEERELFIGLSYDNHGEVKNAQEYHKAKQEGRLMLSPVVEDGKIVVESATFNRVPPHFESFCQGTEGIRSNKKIDDIKLGEFDTSDFGRHGKYISFHIGYGRWTGIPDSEESIKAKQESTMDIILKQSQGRFVPFNDEHFFMELPNTKHSGSLQDYFRDIDETKPTHLVQNDDYRPYFHRALELLLKIHGIEKHDPRMYTERTETQDDAPFWSTCVCLNETERNIVQTLMAEKFSARGGFAKRLKKINRNGNEQYGDRDVDRVLCGMKISSQTAGAFFLALEQDPRVEFLYQIQTGNHPLQTKGTSYKIKEQERIVDTALDVLLTGNEREQIRSKIDEARLKMRANWMSVPRLNLSAIRLPNPGQRDVTTDSFVTEAVPYVVEYLSNLGVMSVEEAEDLAVRRLTNYFVHNSGYQLSRTNAQKIVNILQETKQKKKGAA